MTGKVPSQQQADDLVKELAERSSIPKFLEDVIDSFRECFNFLHRSFCGFQLSTTDFQNPCPILV